MVCRLFELEPFFNILALSRGNEMHFEFSILRKENKSMRSQEEILEEIMADLNVSALSPRIECGVDEFTIVLQPIHRVAITMWSVEAENIIQEFIKSAKLEELFEELESATHNLVQGYTAGYTLNRPFYFCICYNADQEPMGVCCRFSAYAWASYRDEFRKRYDEEIEVSQFLRMVQSDIYTQRLSRIDLTVDYYNMPSWVDDGQYLSPDSIYNALLRGQIEVVDHNGRSNIKSWSGLNKQGEYQTCYVGSKKGNTSGFLRIYDKRLEQLETHGFRYDDAVSCSSWIRFEAVFKNPYSGQIGDAMLDIYTHSDYVCFIAAKVLDKYIFRLPTMDENAYFSELLILVASGIEYEPLKCSSPRDNSLMQSLKYLVKNSGLFITLAKAQRLFPQQGADKQIMEWLEKMFNEYYLPKIEDIDNHEVDKWIRKHRATLKEQSLEDILADVEMEIENEEEWNRKVNSMLAFSAGSVG
jgi:DNA relaxase NicK